MSDKLSGVLSNKMSNKLSSMMSNKMSNKLSNMMSDRMNGGKKKKSSVMGFMVSFRKFVDDFFMIIFRRRRHVKLGLYGAPNSGKTTLANRVCKDWLAEETGKECSCREENTELGKVSRIPHETKQVISKEKINVKAGKKLLSFTLFDTPGIAESINYKNFMKHGMKKQTARRWAREATRGVIESIKQLDEMDAVIIVIDSSKDPYSQVNLTIVGNLAVRRIPFLIVANKTDLRRASPGRVKSAYLDYPFVALSAKNGSNMDAFYKELYTVVR